MTEKIKKWENKYEGERVFIVGNGPSLVDTPLQMLSNEHTIATNKINKIFTKTGWRPDFYILTSLSGKINDSDVKEIIDADVTCFINNKRIGQFGEYNNIYPLTVDFPGNDPRSKCFGDPRVPEIASSYWSDELHEKVYLYNSSIFPTFQLANYLGFDKIYLVGCDLGMDVNKLLFKSGGDPYKFLRDSETCLNESLSISVFFELIRNSDSPLKTMLNVIYASPVFGVVPFECGRDPYDYMKNGVSNTQSQFSKYIKFIHGSDNKIRTLFNGIYTKALHTILKSSLVHDPHFTEYGSENLAIGEDDRQRRAHRLAKQKLEDRNVEVYNATVGGELELYPRVDIKDLLD